MTIFFSPRSRMTVSRPLAIAANTLNLLGPALLLLGAILLGLARFADLPRAGRTGLTTYASALILAAIAIRIVWGIIIRIVRRQATSD
jgi:hypothetical protein